MSISTYVIAEAGSCHENDLDTAVKLIKAAKACGADCIKFQYWSDAYELALRRRVPDSYRDVYKRYELPYNWLQILREEAIGLGLDFMCTVYLPRDVIAVAEFVSVFKIASFEAGCYDLIEAHAPWLAQGGHGGILISLGMGYSGHKVRSNCDLAGIDVNKVRLLHCVSSYPANKNELNLRRIMAEGLDGYSDHSREPAAGAMAVAAGAVIIEAHLRLDDTPKHNPDYGHSFEPALFALYVRGIRNTEEMLGDGSTSVARGEREMLKYRAFA